MNLAKKIDALREEQFVPTAETARSYRNALGSFTTGVAVVTAATPSGPVGMTVNSFASVSLDPPLVLWSVAKSSSRYALLANAEFFAIHVLGIGQHDVCTRFARNGFAFDGLGWSANTDGVPVIDDTLARFECCLHARHDAGDHTLLIGRVLRAAHRPGEALCFGRGAFGRFSPSPSD